MFRLVLPFVVAFALILSLSLREGVMRDRWAEPGIQAAELGERFKQVPRRIGDWEGEDLPVDEVTRQTAGAVSYVSRRYTNTFSGQSVNIWLIVGHSRDICRHTPQVCYPSQGFRSVGGILKQHLETPGQQPAVFFTSKFLKEDPTGRHEERVFWTFNHPETNLWEAPDSPRFHYGMSRALYKLYFVAPVGRDENTADSNVAFEFAGLMLPALNAALFPEEQSEQGPDETTSEQVEESAG